MNPKYSGNPAVPGKERLPSLDGWRALSIVLVLGAHCKVVWGFPQKYEALLFWLFDGFFGVRMFFGISGFLITWLLLVEHRRNGPISLKSFYIRRGLRILPVYCAFLLVLAGLQLFTKMHVSAFSWIGNLTFTTNFTGGIWTNGHLWSLAQEEQFYLIWPGLLAMCLARKWWPAVWWTLALPLVLNPIARVIVYYGAFYPFDQFCAGVSGADSLAIGCATGIIYFKHREFVEGLVTKWRFAAPLSACVMILAPYILSHLFTCGAFTVPFGVPCQEFGFAILLLRSLVTPDSGPFKILNWRWIRELGVLSYSIYIWQEIFSTDPRVFGATPGWYLSFPGWIFASLATAAASYYLFERPLLGLRARFRTVKLA